VGEQGEQEGPSAGAAGVTMAAAMYCRALGDGAEGAEGCSLIVATV